MKEQPVKNKQNKELPRWRRLLAPYLILVGILLLLIGLEYDLELSADIFNPGALDDIVKKKKP